MVSASSSAPPPAGESSSAIAVRDSVGLYTIQDMSGLPALAEGAAVADAHGAWSLKYDAKTLDFPVSEDNLRKFMIRDGKQLAARPVYDTLCKTHSPVPLGFRDLGKVTYPRQAMAAPIAEWQKAMELGRALKNTNEEIMTGVGASIQESVYTYCCLTNASYNTFIVV